VFQEGLRVRDPEELLASGLAVIDTAFQAGATTMAPLFTGIGAKATRAFVESTCREMGWGLRVERSWDTYGKFVRERGFPGPGRHQWVYNRLKDKCVRRIVWQREKNGLMALITGCRNQESVRRMGHVEPLKIGETSKTTGRCRDFYRAWTAPCYDWSVEEQAAYMEHFDLPRNPLKIALGMSGECFCGAFASPGEFERIKHHAPDVADKIERLSVVAARLGKHSVWGTRPAGETGIVESETGPLCSSCDLRASAAGIVVRRR
jgi:3'-phosphoadenosine 5'-phosphosulfate sulfotransferase (PAPS reductase)/FAD synthetase